MRDEFIRVQVATDVWVSACGKCRAVLAFGQTLESLRDAEAENTHDCDEAQQGSAEADVA